MSKKIIFHVAIIISMLIWGISWGIGRSLSGTFSSDILTFWRFLLNFLSFLPLLFFVKVQWVMIINRYTIVSAFLMIAYLYTFFQALTSLPAGFSGTFFTTLVPILTIILTKFLYRLVWIKQEVMGLLLGGLGGVIMTYPYWSLIISDGEGLLWLMSGAIIWSIMTLWSHKSGQNMSPLVMSFGMYFLCTLFMLPAGLSTPIEFFHTPLIFWYELGFIAILSSSLATTIYFYAATKLGSDVAGSYVFIVPLGAILSGMFYLNETISFELIIGACIGALGTFVLRFQRS